MKTIVISTNIKHKMLDKCLGDNFSIKNIISIISKNYNVENYLEAVELLASIENHLHMKINELTKFRNGLQEKYFNETNEKQTNKDEKLINKLCKIKHEIETSNDYILGDETYENVVKDIDKNIASLKNK